MVHSINKKNANFISKEKEYIFIITMDKKLIVVESSVYIRHTSMSHGQPVLGSGALKINNGNLVYIDIESGHYQPPPEALAQALRFLEENGAVSDFKTINVKYYINNKVINEKSGDFLKKHKDKNTALNSMNELTDFKL